MNNLNNNFWFRWSLTDHTEHRRVTFSTPNTRCWSPPESESLRSPPSCSPSCTATGTASKTVQTVAIRGVRRCLSQFEIWKRCKNEHFVLVFILTLQLPTQVDFFWINREQRSFEWFVNLLTQLEIEQAEKSGIMERFLDMHMYITSGLQRTDLKAVSLQLALDLLYNKASSNDHQIIPRINFDWINLIGQARSDNWTEDEDESGSAKLGQSVPAAAGSRQRKNHRLLLWSTSTWKGVI